MTAYHSRLVVEDLLSVKDYDLHECKTIWLMNFKSNKFGGKKWLSHLCLLDDETYERVDENTIDITVVNLQYMSTCNIIELKELALLFTKSYDEIMKLEFKYQFTKEMVTMIENFNITDEKLKNLAWCIQSEERDKFGFIKEKKKQELELKKLELKKNELETQKNELEVNNNELKLQNSELESKAIKLKNESNKTLQEKYNLIKIMYQNNIDINVIATASNLSKEEVLKIVK